MAVAAELGRLAGMLGAGGWGLKWLVKRYDKQTAEIRQLSSQAKEECLKREETNRDECMKREAAIVKRLQSVEDEQRGDSRTLLLRSASALEMNGKAFKALAENPSGLHPAISDGRASPGSNGT